MDQNRRFIFIHSVFSNLKLAFITYACKYLFYTCVAILYHLYTNIVNIKC